MKIAVIQHQMRPAPAQDLEALVLVVSHAGVLGADVVVVPDVRSEEAGPLGGELDRRIAEESGGIRLIQLAADAGGDAAEIELWRIWDEPDLGRVALISGDGCLDGAVLREVSAQLPGLAILSPRSESELQAEAMIETAIALSTSLASVVVIAETDGAEPGAPGHGGSAVIHLGELLAEALSGDDLLVVDLPVPLGPPEVPAALPEVAGLLAQRLAAHRGERVQVDYPADLS